MKYSNENNILRKEFWIKKGYSEKVSLQKIKEEQFKRFNYDSDFSEKVSKGKKLYYKNLTDEEKDKWEKIYIKHSQKMKRDLSFSPIFEDYWIKRGYSKENSKIKSLEARYVNPKNYSSNIEKKCIKEIEDFLKIDIQKNKYVMILSNVFVVDGKFENLIIEFNGTNSHLDSRFYDDKSFTPWGKSFSQKHKEDENRNLIILSKYNLLIIWEYDYLNRKELILKNIKKIYDEIKNRKSGKMWNSSSF